MTLRAFQGRRPAPAGQPQAVRPRHRCAWTLPGEAAQGGDAALPQPRQGGAATIPTGAQRAAQPPAGGAGGAGELDTPAWWARTGATAAEASRVLRVEAVGWRTVRVRWPVTVW